MYALAICVKYRLISRYSGEPLEIALLFIETRKEIMYVAYFEEILECFRFPSTVSEASSLFSRERHAMGKGEPMKRKVRPQKSEFRLQYNWKCSLSALIASFQGHT